MVPMFTCGFVRSNFSFAIASLLLFRNRANSKPNSLPSSLAGGLADHFFRHGSRGFRIVGEVHGKIRATLRAAAQIRRVPKHLRKGHLHADNMTTRTRFRTLNLSAARVQIAK